MFLAICKYRVKVLYTYGTGTRRVCTLRSRKGMADILQSTISNAFSLIFCRLIQISLKFVHNGTGMEPNRHQAIIWTDGGLVYLFMFASLGINLIWTCINCHETYIWLPSLVVFVVMLASILYKYMSWIMVIGVERHTLNTLNCYYY